MVTNPREEETLGLMYVMGSGRIPLVEEFEPVERFLMGGPLVVLPSEKGIKRKFPGSVVLPIYTCNRVFDLGILDLSTKPYDISVGSGLVGFIIATPESIKKRLGVSTLTAKKKKEVEAILAQEVYDFVSYLHNS